ncbi:MAG: type II toxin-antitoxin system HicA family toxin [Saprospiraceae bacterium]|nr:type II toxin-antitoxin system HicA family toxin [Saprospiraceae bacterium]
MKCSEFLRLLKKDGWFAVSQNGSHLKMKHPTKEGLIIFPNHGSAELGKGLEFKLRKDAQIR